MVLQVILQKTIEYKKNRDLSFIKILFTGLTFIQKKEKTPELFFSKFTKRHMIYKNSLLSEV